MQGPNNRAPSFRAVLAFSVALSACAAAEHGPAFDALKQPRPPAPHTVGGVPVSGDDYERVVRWGASWFRYETFGGERAITDLIGFFAAPIEVPCPAAPGAHACTQTESALRYFIRALDDLDGVRGNLYSGNGGFEGKGFTHDLVVRFPPGSRVARLPLPEEVHTGLDVEAGSAWPIGISPVPAESDAHLPYVWDLASFDAGPVNGPAHVRVGITCALCHYSLDVDWDGRTDLRSAELDRPTPGSPYRPEHAWAVGNQDLKVGWLFALSQNPLVGFSVLSGPVGVGQNAEAAYEWATWLKEHYRSAPEMVRREVIRGMLVQPRGFADVSPNARYDASQFPPLYTQRYFPSNSDGSILNAADRDNIAWTGTMDFSGLVGLARDRGSSVQLPWEPRSVYDAFTAEELADLMVYLSPAGMNDPGKRAELARDILGVSDGIPGLMDPASMYVMAGPPNTVPAAVFNHPDNQRFHRQKAPEDYGGDAPLRGPLMALLGLRVHTRPKVATALGLDAFLARYPQLSRDEFMAEAVNTMLDWQPSPPNVGARALRAKGLVARGAEEFAAAGCTSCHRGAFFTDNLVHRMSARRAEELGVAAASTAAWRSLGRGTGPAIGTNPEHASGSRPLVLFLAPAYDVQSGAAKAAGGALRGLFGDRPIGYKTSQLRYLWGSAPYLHDGGVGIAIAPESRVDRDDLARVLALPDCEKVYGMGAILAREELTPGQRLRPDAALSLQALLLQVERAKILARRNDSVIPVRGAGTDGNALGAPPAVSALALGIDGAGHDFYLDDAPGGARVTALVAFLLALDDSVGDATAWSP